jgi:hypothetical protein
MVWFFRQIIILYIAMRFPSCDQPGVSRVYVARLFLGWRSMYLGTKAQPNREPSGLSPCSLVRSRVLLE